MKKKSKTRRTDYDEMKERARRRNIRLSAAGREERQRLIAVMQRPRTEISEEDVRDTIALYERLGSLEFARAKADELVREAFDTIEHMPLASKDFFRDVARFMAERTT